MRSRVIASLVILVLIFLAPYWLYLPVLVLSTIFFSYYWEGVVFAILIDVLYGTLGGGFFLADFPITISIAFLFVLAPLLQARLRIRRI